jgi:diketogulonate reductase-like aldo/keto reductase
LIETLTEIGKQYSATPGQVALNWLITYTGKTVVAIPGATKLGHAQESAGAMTFTLSKAELNEIAKESEKL